MKVASQSKGRRVVTLWTRDDLSDIHLGPISVCLPLIQTNMLNSGLDAISEGVWTLAILWILVTVAACLVLRLLRKVLFSRAAAQPVGIQPIWACTQHV